MAESKIELDQLCTQLFLCRQLCVETLCMDVSVVISLSYAWWKTIWQKSKKKNEKKLRNKELARVLIFFMVYNLWIENGFLSSENVSMTWNILSNLEIIS